MFTMECKIEDFLTLEDDMIYFLAKLAPYMVSIIVVDVEIFLC